jgi:hypothetical protein
MGIKLSDLKQGLSNFSGNEVYIDKMELKHLQEIKKTSEELYMVHTYTDDVKRFNKLMNKLGNLLLKKSLFG